MPTTQAKPAPRNLPWLRPAMTFLIVVLVLGWGFHWVSHAVNQRAEPAGLGFGIIHGVLMPMALPNLAMGNDVPIYAARNTGVSYKLGYTIGVNACGMVFFAIFFWRLRRLRHQFLRKQRGHGSELSADSTVERSAR